MQVVARIQNGVVVRWVIAGVFVLAYAAWCVHDGWFNEEYRKPERASDLQFNRGAAMVLPLLGVGCIAWAVVLMQRRLVADDAGLRSGRTRFEWKQVASIDDSDLEQKTILRLGYGDGQTFVLDGYIWTEFEAILELIEERVDRSVLPASLLDDAALGVASPGVLSGDAPASG